MYLIENPVLQRELLVNLRMRRAFVLLAAYVGLLGLVVFAAWPNETKLDLAADAVRAAQADAPSPPGKRLVDLFFLGQYILMAMMAPSFAAGAIAGEKERKTYEMLLASPLRPMAIVLGKLLAALAHLAVLVFASLPIVMLCLPLGGGISLWEVLATYTAMAASVVTFGMISIAASGYFRRTIAALVVSYMVIVPLVLVGVLLYTMLETEAVVRLVWLAVVFPAVCLAACIALARATGMRLMHPPDVAGDTADAVDADTEQAGVMGMVIRSDQFPDRLFAPPKRSDLLPDGANPVYDKEMRSELFSQGTLVLRLVIQLSMGLALPLMAVFLYIRPELAPWYVAYVLLFNMLVGPVFAAGAVSGERERQTLELLLTTTLSPWQIIRAKLYAGLRISCVLTSFLAWPLLLACVLPPWTYRQDLNTILVYLAIIIVTSATTPIVAVFCSVLFRKTLHSMVAAYVAVIAMFILPVAVKAFADALFPPRAALVYHAADGQIGYPAEFSFVGMTGGQGDMIVSTGESLEAVAARINAQSNVSGVAAVVEGDELMFATVGDDPAGPIGFRVFEGYFPVRPPPTIRLRRWMLTSPMAAAAAMPLTLATEQPVHSGAQWWRWTPISFLVFCVVLDSALIALMVALFNRRRRAAR